MWFYCWRPTEKAVNLHFSLSCLLSLLFSITVVWKALATLPTAQVPEVPEPLCPTGRVRLGEWRGLEKLPLKKKNQQNRLRLKMYFSLEVWLLYNVVLISAIQNTTKWISCLYMYILSWASILPLITELRSLLLYSSFPLAICFTHGSVYMSMLLSQFAPPSPFPCCVHQSVELAFDCLSLLFGLPEFAPYLRLEGNCAHYVTLAGKECSSEHLGEENIVLERAPQCFLATCM